MATEFIRQLLEAGVHFGHQTKRWNPKMQKFIFGERNGIYIIDLEKTAIALEEARGFLKEIASKGGNILFVGTKKQAQEAIIADAQRAGAFYIGQRWVGGLLTNFQTVKKSIKRLKELEKMREDGVMAKLSKKEAASLIKEINKLKKNFSGIMNMEQLPDAIFIIDPKKEETAILEARRLNVPIVALIDTNSDPDLVDFPIPGNDDAIKSIKLIISLVADSVAEGRQEFLHTKKTVDAQPSPTQEEALPVVETANIEALVPEEELEKIEKVEEPAIDKVARKKPKRTKEE